MKDIGSDLKSARISSSVSLEEASKDTDIPVYALEQIEEGNIGSFKDIFVLKDYLELYAKYLGLDGKQIIDNFNEYMFEYTTKIPLGSLEKAIRDKEKEDAIKEANDDSVKVVSPYLKPSKNNDNIKLVFSIVVIIILVAITIIWAIKLVS